MNFIFVFGFFDVLPQLYVCYKLEFTNNLPWNFLLLKCCNKFLDHFLSYSIRIPIMKRTPILREDVLYFAFVYMAKICKEKKEKEINYNVQKLLQKHEQQKEELLQQRLEQEAQNEEARQRQI